MISEFDAIQSLLCYMFEQRITPIMCSEYEHMNANIEGSSEKKTSQCFIVICQKAFVS